MLSISRHKWKRRKPREKNKMECKEYAEPEKLCGKCGLYAWGYCPELDVPVAANEEGCIGCFFIPRYKRDGGKG